MNSLMTLQDGLSQRIEEDLLLVTLKCPDSLALQKALHWVKEKGQEAEDTTPVSYLCGVADKLQ